MEIDVFKLLGPKYVLKDALEHLNNIGIIKTTNGYEEKNMIMKHQLIIHVPIWIGFIRSLIALVLEKKIENEFLFLLIGDFHYYTPSYQNHYNVMILVCSIIGLYSYRLKLNHSSNTLKPFLMIRGMLTPIEVGLNREKEIKMLLRRSKLIFRFSKLLINSITILVIPYSSFIILTNYSTNNLIILGIPWLLIFIFTCYFLCANIITLIGYFHLNCYYISLKLRVANQYFVQNLIRRKRRLLRSQIIGVLRRFNRIYHEIDQDNNFWCKYSAIVYFNFVTTILGSLYQAIFGEVHLILRFVLIYFVFGTLLVCMVYTFSAALIYETWKETFIIFNKFYCQAIFPGLACKIKVIKFLITP